VLKQGQDLGKFGRDFNVSVLVYSNPEDSQVLMALRERNPEVIIVKGGAVFVESPYMPKNVIQLTEFGNSALKQGYLLFRGDDFDANIHVKMSIV
jgi:hypothetical protein